MSQYGNTMGIALQNCLVRTLLLTEEAFTFDLRQ